VPRIVIRAAAPSDLASLVAVDSFAASHPARCADIARWLTDHTGFLAEIEGKIAGYAVTHPHFFGEVMLEMLMVAPRWRRRGVGAALVAHAVKTCRTPRLWTSTNQSNLPMQALLDRLGFVRSGIVEGLDEGDPELIYRLDRTAPPST
jgi:GNAT superfamily N-acetyltransferase